MKTIYCTICSVKVGELASGSKIKNGIGYMCPKCLDVYNTKNAGDAFRDIGGKKDDFGKIFGDLFK